MATHYFASHQGGIEIVAGHLFQEMAALPVTWTATDATPPPEPSGQARIVCLRATNFVERKIGLPFPIPTPGALLKLRQEVRAADVVIIHDCLYLTNIAAYFFARAAGIPVIVIQHIGLVSYSNPLLRGLMKLANRFVTRNMLQGAQQVVFISETTRRYFEGLRFKADPTVIFNGVDTDTFQPAPCAKARHGLKRNLGLPLDRPIILFVGRFVEKKGLAVLERMPRMCPEYAWVFAGWGPLDPRKWGAPNVHVFSDLRGASLADLYRASDLFVLPSSGEGFPLVVQEALACGLPVICGSETAGADAALSELVTGAELHADNHTKSAEEFLREIKKLLGPEEGRNSAARQRHSFVESRYSWKHAAARYLEIATRLVPEDKRPPIRIVDETINAPRALSRGAGA